MNYFKIAPVGPNGHRPASISTELRNAASRQALQDRWRRMPVAVPAHTNHGDSRSDGIQPGVTSASSRTVMRDFEHVQPFAPCANDLGGHQQRLGWEPDVAGEERGETARGNANHE